MANLYIDPGWRDGGWACGSLSGNFHFKTDDISERVVYFKELCNMLEPEKIICEEYHASNGRGKGAQTLIVIGILASINSLMELVNHLTWGAEGLARIMRMFPSYIEGYDVKRLDFMKQKNDIANEHERDAVWMQFAYEGEQ